MDDNVGAAKMLAMLLKRLGPHEVETAHDGPSTLEKAEEFKPNLVLLDIGLPRMDGLAVATELRKRAHFADTLLAALTGFGQEEDRQRSKEAGFDEHLIKPVDVDTLRQLLEHPKLSS
ncbi:response regulator [Candidatus Laterigemmans baculatus]|uniref:response regulator n=1 Tax=Candidatus Laterigemmans baculatus TaxID=2770505 RepID=UPI00193FD005|nr:response regulator [Candidatus Laterigemmans baculatus]